MKDINEVRHHIFEKVYTHKARKAIYYWLLGKGVIENGQILVFKEHTWKDGLLTTEGHSLEDFIAWFNSTEYLAMSTSTKSGSFIQYDGSKDVLRINLCDIKIGDYVKVIDSDNPRSEYVEAVALWIDKSPVVCLSDGTWAKSSSVVPYKVQGDERTALIDKLNETK